jgi:hypothetical protein
VAEYRLKEAAARARAAAARARVAAERAAMVAGAGVPDKLTQCHRRR